MGKMTNGKAANFAAPFSRFYHSKNRMILVTHYTRQLASCHQKQMTTLTQQPWRTKIFQKKILLVSLRFSSLFVTVTISQVASLDKGNT